jgi:hypothetical protein
MYSTLLYNKTNQAPRALHSATHLMASAASRALLGCILLFLKLALLGDLGEAAPALKGLREECGCAWEGGGMGSTRDTCWGGKDTVQRSIAG